MKQIAGKVGLKKNVVRLHGIIQKPVDYLDDLQSGFESMYLFLLRNKERVQAAVQDIFGRKSSNIRVLFLSTMFYELVSRQAGTLSNLRDGVDWSIELDRIASRMNRQEERPGKWPVIQAEHAALVNMDVPYFKVRSDSTTLAASGGKQAEIFSMTGFNAVLKKISGLSEEDLKIQLRFIRASIIARSASGIDRPRSGVTADLPGDQRPLEKAALIDQALHLARSIRDQAIISDDGGASWIALEYDHHTERYQLVPVRSGLYSGNAGIGLFLAHASKMDKSLRELVIQTLQPIITLIQSRPESIVYEEGLGGATGAASIIYSLVSVAQAMNQPSLIEDANAMAAAITSDLIEQDQIFDVVGGSAGAILGLNKLFAATRSNSVLEVMKQCGDHLLKNMVKASEGGYGWKIGIHPPLTGFSHGAGGIAFALSVLYKHTGDKKIATAVEQAVRFEREVFDKKAMNWPDFRNKINPGPDNFMTTWCHGASGIGLSRIGIFENTNDRSYIEEIDQAVETTLRFGIGGIDHLCCGNLGRMDLLLHAGSKLNRPSLINHAEMITRTVIERAIRNNSFNIIRGIQGGANSPGFFSGLSGIGYQLLRITDPGNYPSVLLWE